MQEENYTTPPTPQKAEQPKEEVKESAPVFKIQILTSTTKLNKNDKRFKGKKVDFYKEGGVYKYTCEESTNYDTILRKSKEIKKTFSGAFIIAFKNGKRIDLKEAIKEYKSKK